VFPSAKSRPDVVPGPFEIFYGGSLQSVWLLLVVPLGYLAWRASRPLPGRSLDPALVPFLAFYTVAFAVETVLDPLATGPLAGALGGTVTKTGLSLLFVLLGDWRVYLLVLVVAGTTRAVPLSILATFAVPVFAYLLAGTLGRYPDRVLWLIHELLFVAATFVLRRLSVARAAPERRPFLTDVLDYVALYYGLWALADVMILAGADWGYALRVVPNHLYYALFIPFVHYRFWGRSSEA
jgi:hypothetical protein